MATIEDVFDVVCKTFRISALNAPQKNGITKIVEERRDVFINLPTGFGEERWPNNKSLYLSIYLRTAGVALARPSTLLINI